MKVSFSHQSRAISKTAGMRTSSVTGWLAYCRQLVLITLLCAPWVAPAYGNEDDPAIISVGFLCTDSPECSNSAIRDAVEVQTTEGPVILAVGASLNSTKDDFPITPILYSSVSDQLFPLPAIDDTPNSTFLMASMITPDGRKIASRAHYGRRGRDPTNLRSAVVVNVDPGSPAFSSPTFENVLLDPDFANNRTAADNISDDGSVAYGFGSTGEFIWTEESGLTVIGPPTDDVTYFGSTVGNSTSKDGSKVLVSHFTCVPDFTLCDQRANVYNKATDSFTRIRPLEGHDSVGAFAMSSNGKYVAGQSYLSTLDFDVFLVEGEIVIWNANTGMPFRQLGTPDQTGYASNFGGVTNDGQAVVVGFEDSNFDNKRSYLVNKHGSHLIENVLTDLGIDIAEWLFSFDNATCASVGNGVGCFATGGTGLLGLSPDGGLIFGAAIHNVDATLLNEGLVVKNIPKHYLKNYSD